MARCVRDFDLFGTRFLALPLLWYKKTIITKKFFCFFVLLGKKILKKIPKKNVMKMPASRLGARHPFCLDERVGKRGAGVF
jgi:hypothetical protein